jgi:adenylylsulfate kinase
VQLVFDARLPTALFVGRYQPFHDGHRQLIEEGIRRVGQACVAIRYTHGIDDKNPLSFADVESRIIAGLAHLDGRFIVMSVPNIMSIFYGRGVGYSVERIYLDAGTEAISSTDIRRNLNFERGSIARLLGLKG